MRVWGKVKTTPLWLMAPSLMVAAAAGAVAAGHEPLVFDPSAYETPTANAAELKTVDAAAIEKRTEAASAPKKVTAASAKAHAGGALADGTWTGYAVCGRGNTDGWKPYYVATTVKVAGGKAAGIVKIAGSSSAGPKSAKLSWDAAENQSYLDWAVKGRSKAGKSYMGVRAQIAARIASGKSVSDIDAVSGATYSSQSAVESYLDALDKAAAAAGASKKKRAKVTARKEALASGTESYTPPDISTEGSFSDGVYSGYALCADLYEPSRYKPYYIFVDVEVASGKVVRIGDIHGDAEGVVDKACVYDSKENASYLNLAIYGTPFKAGVQASIQDKLDAGEAVAGIDAISGATWSSRSIVEAFGNAVQNALSQSGADGEGQAGGDAGA